MSDTTPTPTPTPADPKGGAPNVTPPGGTTPTPTQIDPQEYTKLQEQFAAQQKQLEAFQKAEEERKNAQLSEQERAAQELAKVQSQLKKTKVELAAQSAGMKYPARALAFLADCADTDEARAAALAELKKEIPELFGAATPSPTPVTNPGRTTTSQGSFTRSQIKDPVFYREHEKNILQAMREGRIVEG